MLETKVSRGQLLFVFRDGTNFTPDQGSLRHATIQTCSHTTTMDDSSLDACADAAIVTCRWRNLMSVYVYPAQRVSTTSVLCPFHTLSRSKTRCIPEHKNLSF
jgi:hypothetical protein